VSSCAISLERVENSGIIHFITTEFDPNKLRYGKGNTRNMFFCGKILLYPTVKASLSLCCFNRAKLTKGRGRQKKEKMVTHDFFVPLRLNGV